MAQRDYTVNVQGLTELRRRLRATDVGALGAVQSTLRRAAGLAAEEASRLAPRRTGALAGSYRPFARGNIAGVRSRLPYAGVIEFGGTISPRGAEIRFERSEPVTRAIEHERDAIERTLVGDFDAMARRNGWR